MKQAMLWPAAALGLLFCGSAAAQDCELTIEGNDQIMYDKSELVVPAGCDEVTVTMEHVGDLPVEQMGHNWVLTTSSDWEAVAQAGQAQGLENDYLPPNDDRIIAATDMVGGGESTSVTVDVSSLDPDESYTFFCSFPGHYALMNGEFIIQ